ncbi:hypothetical protein EIP91_001143 [Steccherinum ochraceum]|uniref:Uncharacterized protein n=1 Tax=Steccherinum ochraceum TaxID=92696 RepID=A0A4R0RGX4_9APHY|nr:hypothetical protein EIP91_001143 [Steccherinum ochraceum]
MAHHLPSSPPSHRTHPVPRSILYPPPPLPVTHSSPTAKEFPFAEDIYFHRTLVVSKYKQVLGYAHSKEEYDRARIVVDNDHRQATKLRRTATIGEGDEKESAAQGMARRLYTAHIERERGRSARPSTPHPGRLSAPLPSLMTNTGSDDESDESNLPTPEDEVNRAAALADYHRTANAPGLPSSVMELLARAEDDGADEEDAEDAAMEARLEAMARQRAQQRAHMETQIEFTPPSLAPPMANVGNPRYPASLSASPAAGPSRSPWLGRSVNAPGPAPSRPAPSRPRAPRPRSTASSFSSGRDEGVLGGF